jgi:hypothetical protein
MESVFTVNGFSVDIDVVSTLLMHRDYTIRNVDTILNFFNGSNAFVSYNIYLLVA